MNSLGGLGLLGNGEGGPAGVRAGFVDGAVEGEAIDDRGVRAWAGEGFSSASFRTGNGETPAK